MMKKSLFIHVLIDLSIIFLLFLIKVFKENKDKTEKIIDILNDLSYDMEFVEIHLKELKNSLNVKEI